MRSKSQFNAHAPPTRRPRVSVRSPSVYRYPTKYFGPDPFRAAKSFVGDKIGTLAAALPMLFSESRIFQLSATEPTGSSLLTRGLVLKCGAISLELCGHRSGGRPLQRGSLRPTNRLILVIHSFPRAFDMPTLFLARISFSRSSTRYLRM